MARRPAPTPEELRLLDPDRMFVERLAADRAALATSVAAGDALRTRAIVHGLAGAAGTFGYTAIGDIALELDAAAAAGENLSQKAIFSLLEALERSLKSA
ncbi:MAG: Hpt domain-containing protein [Devosia sp.]